MPTDMMTMCFHTRDAVKQEQSSFTFRIPSDRLRTDAVKVALASCEFPIVQWTIEDQWNRLYTNEGVAITPDTSFMDIACDGDVMRISLPLRSNSVTTSLKGNKLRIKCDNSHGLTDAIFKLPGDVVLLGGVGGDVSLTDAYLRGKLTYEDERTIVLDRKNGDSAVGAHTLIVPTISSIHDLCFILTTAAQLSFETLRLTFEYDATCDTIRLTGTSSTDVIARVVASPLVLLCGLSSMDVRVTSSSPVTWPSEPTRFWDYVLMPSGFYAPCHRPMCTGQPMRFGSELESAINRLYFPVVKQGEAMHQLVFSDPRGRVFTCSIPAGRYTPGRFCAHLEQQMTNVVGDANVSFAVQHGDDDRFVISCEEVREGSVHPAPFSLLFHHPMCIDPVRLGFPPHPLMGSDTYTGSSPIRFAKHGDGNYMSNIIRVEEIVSQKRFRFHVTAPPPMVALVIGSAGDDVLHVQTHVNRMKFSHGYQVGDVIQLCACNPMTLVGDDGTETQYDPMSAALPSRCSAVVVASTSQDVTILSLRIPHIKELCRESTIVQVTCAPKPFNLCTSRPHSIPAHLMGLRQGATQWGIDGSILDAQGNLLPPFDAPYTHCLDHPDYVLLTFSESSGASLEHSYDNENKQVFCKLSLYPLFREERMLPRDTTLMRGNLNTFTISFWNPDMRTPYCFHGANFSFSLNFLSSVPE